MSLCHHAVVGGLLIHQGRIAVAMRQKPPLNLAPSAGHVDLEDGLAEGGPDDFSAFRRAAAREIWEETGLPVEKGSLRLLLTYQADDWCAKEGENGTLGGQHLWQVFGYPIETISRPSLTDEPGKMHGWTWRSVRSLLEDERLEPIWFTLLTEIVQLPQRDRMGLSY